MPSRGGRKRTDRESLAFKLKVIKLRGQNKSIVEIAKQMGVTRQYVSLVLIGAGLGKVKDKQRKKKRPKMRAKDDNIDADILRLEQQGEYSLANSLRVLARRRKD
jgi:hypothetical protein